MAGVAEPTYMSSIALSEYLLCELGSNYSLLWDEVLRIEVTFVRLDKALNKPLSLLLGQQLSPTNSL